MLQRMALASAKVLANLQTPCRRSSLLGNKGALQVPALSRSLTGGEVREAARNAKAYLLRAHAASGQATDAQTAAPAQSSFLNLSVDDRVVVSPAAHLVGVMLDGPQRLHRSWRASRFLLAGPPAGKRRTEANCRPRGCHTCYHFGQKCSHAVLYRVRKGVHLLCLQKNISSLTRTLRNLHS